MPEQKIVQFTAVDDNTRKLVFEPHDAEGHWTLVEYQRDQGGWRFAGETLVTDLRICDSDDIAAVDEVVI